MQMHALEEGAVSGAGPNEVARLHAIGALYDDGFPLLLNDMHVVQ